MRRWVKGICIGAVCFLGGYASLALAGGFQLLEASAASLGNAFAGRAATAEDASTEFYNPAGMVLIKRPQMVLSGTLIQLGINAHVNSATTTTHATIALTSPINIGTFNIAGTKELTGGNDLKPGGWNPVPAFHFVTPIGDSRYSFGFGIAAPFGLKTDYPADSIVRDLATESQIKVINIGPALRER